MSDELVERVARAMCATHGYEPDGLTYREARAAIAVVLEEVLNLCLYQNEYDDSVSSHAEFMTCARISFAVQRLLEDVKNG